MMILKKILLFVLVLSFSFQSNANLSRCPDLFKKEQQISPEIMNQLVQESKSNENIRVKRNELNTITSFKPSANLNLSSSSDDAVIVFAVIGLVVIVAWVPYAVAYLYNLTQGEVDYCPWYRVSLNSKKIFNSSSEISIERNAEFHGVSLGVASLKESYSFMGFSVQLGAHSILDKVDSDHTRYNGTYFMIGPSVVLGRPSSSQFISMELLAGGSTHEDVDLVAEAALNWNISFNSQAVSAAPFLSLNFGGNYLQVDKREAFVNYFNEYSLFWGAGFGLSF